LLDVDLGSYPFVTSSNTTVGGLLSGSGLPPRALTNVRGVCKAYSTRVGAGPYTSELADATGDLLRKRGGEFGATTGRPRRCGWFDAVSARFAVDTNGVDEIVLTKSDILSGFDSLKVCVAYEIDGKETRTMPASSDALARAKPVYETLPGWKEEIAACRDYDALPAAMRSYVSFLEKECGAAIRWVSVGPTRDALIVRR
jgi:adenylosuccinate synthase